MRPQNENGPGLKEHLGLAAGLARITAAPWMLLCSKEGTVGWRVIGGFLPPFGLAMIALWGLVTASPGLLYAGLPLGVITIVVHKARSKADGRVHSLGLGESHLMRFTGNPLTARYLEAAAAFLTGLVLRDEDFGAGSYLMAAGACEVVVLLMAVARERHIAADLSDAYIEATVRADRMTHRPGGE